MPTFRAPGRVNLIGEHTDYNGGFVLPAAIGLYTTVKAEPSTANKLIIHSANFSQTQEFDPTDEVPRKHWTDYPRGVYLMLRRAGVPLCGAQLHIQGDVPLGAGLSSSASIEVAVAAALLAIAHSTISGKELALLCQKAENEFTGAQCGIMDQFIAVHGRAGNAVLIDCHSLDHQMAPIPAGISLVIANTMVRHALTGGEYNQRRKECESAASKMGFTSLRQANFQMLEDAEPLLTPTEFRRAHHVITENARVKGFINAHPLRMGLLMAASHNSLAVDFEVSCTELDAMVDAAQNLPGLIGARMTGGGFGGSTINLVETDCVPLFTKCLAEEYKKRTGIHPEIIVTAASQGVHQIA